MAGEESVFIKIDDPVDFRKAILEASRDTVHELQRYEWIKEVRTKKVQAMVELRELLKELNLLINRLKTQMPTVDLKSPKPAAPKKKEKAVKGNKDEPVKKGVLSKGKELADLEKQLGDIEKKLSSLS